MRLNQEKKLKYRPIVKPKVYTSGSRRRRSKIWNLEFGIWSKEKFKVSWRAVFTYLKLFLPRADFLFLRKVFVFLLIFAWLFSGWPGIFSYAQETTSTPTLISETPVKEAQAEDTPSIETTTASQDNLTEAENSVLPTTTPKVLSDLQKITSVDEIIIDQTATTTEIKDIFLPVFLAEKDNFDFNEAPVFRIAFKNVSTKITEELAPKEEKEETSQENFLQKIYKLISNFFGNKNQNNQDNAEENDIGISDIAVTLNDVNITHLVYLNQENDSEFIIDFGKIKDFSPGIYTLKLSVNQSLIAEVNFVWGGKPLKTYELGKKKIFILSKNNEDNNQELWLESRDDDRINREKIASTQTDSSDRWPIKINSPIGFLENNIFWLSVDGQAIVGYDMVSNMYFSQTLERQNNNITIQSQSYRILIDDKGIDFVLNNDENI